MTARVRKVTAPVEKKGYSSGNKPASQITVPKEAQVPGAGTPSTPKDGGDNGATGGSPDREGSAA
jgi:hypothetical protein